MKCALAIALIAAIGCKKQDPPPTNTTDLVLVSPGALPQRTLRYAAPKGQKTTLEIVIDDHISAGDTGGSSPGLVFTIDLVVDDVLPDGRMKLVATIVELVSPAGKAEPGGAHVIDLGAQLKGSTVQATLAPDGIISDVTFDTSKVSDIAREQLGQLANALPHLAMPLPTIPVGIGAKWRSTRPLAPATPMKLTSVTTIDLAGIEGSQLDVVETSELHGEDQLVQQGGATVDVKGIGGTASGHGKIDLRRLVWIGTFSAELHMDMAIGSDQTKMVMLQTVTTAIQGEHSAP